MKIAIPTYRRPQRIQTMTLAFLEQMKVDPEEVYLFVADNDEMIDYAAALPAKWARRLYVGVPGVNHVRNHIQRFFNEGEEVVYMDDDIRTIWMRHEGITMKTPRAKQAHKLEPAEFRAMVKLGFKSAAKEGARIWGVYPTSNPMHMRNRVYVGLAYVVAAFFGMRITHDPDVYTRYGVKEDHERTLRYYVKDGCIVRLDTYGVDTPYFGGTGGLHDDGLEARHARANLVIDKLIAEFPGLVKELQRKDYRDVKLARLGKRDALL
jgi:hypothetical protein